MKYALIGLAALLGLAGLAVGPWLIAPDHMLAAVQVMPIEKALGEPSVTAAPRGDLAVYRGGEGPTMVLVHGFGDSASGWGQVAGQLTDTHHLVIPDLPGSGLSAPGPDEDLHFADVEDALERILADEPDPLILVGNSMGGMLVAHYALAHPERDLQIVLVNAAIVDNGIPTSELIPTTRDELAIKNERLFGDRAPKAPGPVADALLRMQDQHRYRTLLEDIRSQDLWLGERARDLGHPTTVIWGTPDGYFPLEDVATWHDDPVVLETCGHAPQYICPDELASALTEL